MGKVLDTPDTSRIGLSRFSLAYVGMLAMLAFTVRLRGEGCYECSNLLNYMLKCMLKVLRCVMKIKRAIYVLSNVASVLNWASPSS